MNESVSVMKREIKTVALVLTLFTVSTYIYSTTLQAYTVEIDDLIHVETNKQSYRQGDIVKVSVYLSNPHPRPVKYLYYTSYGIDGNYAGEFNEAILTSVNVSPSSDWYHLAPFGREYLIFSREFVVNKAGNFHITFKMDGGSKFTHTKTVIVS